MAKRQLSMTRSAITKRLRRRGIEHRGYTLEQLREIDRSNRNAPVVVKEDVLYRKREKFEPAPRPDNFETLKNILNHFATLYEEFFVGVFRDAWKYVPRIREFYTKLDAEKVNSDESFIPREIVISYVPPSDYEIDEEPNLDPRDIVDYLEKLYDKYRR